MLIIEVSLSTEVLIKKRLICISVAIKASILTDLSEDVLGGVSSYITSLSYFVSEVGKQFLLKGCQAFSDPLLSLPVKAIQNME